MALTTGQLVGCLVESSILRLRTPLPATPTVLFLDEPTASLYPEWAKTTEDVIRTLEQGIKFVISKHDLAEARRLAGDVVHLHRGACWGMLAGIDAYHCTADTGNQAFVAGELPV